MAEPDILPLSALLAPDGLTPKNRIVFDYWQSLRRDGALPRRSDLEPAPLRPVLDRLCLFDAKADEWLICRLAGSAIVQALGIELSGKDFRSYTRPTIGRSAWPITATSCRAWACAITARR